MSENKFSASDDSTAAQGSSENPAANQSTSAAQDAAIAKSHHETAGSPAPSVTPQNDEATKAELYNLYTSRQLGVPQTTSISKPKVGDNTVRVYSAIPLQPEKTTIPANAKKRRRSPIAYILSLYSLLD
ncbi:hypothetical protein E1301_Tti017604 [Triplophysa tibetana]|uniref:Uncharacterized protein n=1 Tax=Triplophysa tibetana TaxID=1572043 RepID=A0A5A9P1K5_9TELE|nr:hypothetical protein E1301_Tti017604 [Triplophysa tibetana]